MATDNSSSLTSGNILVDLVETAQELKCLFLQRMDTLNTAKLDKAVLAKLASPGVKKIVFDLAKVDYIDSSFLRLCVRVSKAGPGEFAIVNVTPTVRKVLTIAGFENLAEIS